MAISYVVLFYHYKRECFRQSIILEFLIRQGKHFICILISSVISSITYKNRKY